VHILFFRSRTTAPLSDCTISFVFAFYAVWRLSRPVPITNRQRLNKSDAKSSLARCLMITSVGFFSWRFSAASSDAEVHFPLYLTIKLNPKTATVRQENGPERTNLLKFVTLRRLFLEDLENSCCILLNSLHLVFSSCLFRSCATVTRAIVRHC
jgi:hypothetical protein